MTHIWHYLETYIVWSALLLTAGFLAVAFNHHRNRLRTFRELEKGMLHDRWSVRQKLRVLLQHLKKANGCYIELPIFSGPPPGEVEMALKSIPAFTAFGEAHSFYEANLKSPLDDLLTLAGQTGESSESWRSGGAEHEQHYAGILRQTKTKCDALFIHMSTALLYLAPKPEKRIERRGAYEQHRARNIEMISEIEQHVESLEAAYRLMWRDYYVNTKGDVASIFRSFLETIAVIHGKKK